MKLRFSDRLLTVLLAVFFLMLAAAIVAESVFGAQVLAAASRLLQDTSAVWVVIRVAVILLCMVMAWLCLRITFRRSSRNDLEFVEQKTEGSELLVSVKAIEGLVRKCVANHEEMTLSAVHLENHKNGLTVALTIQTAADISIPMAVSALEQQLREYVMESTGVDISEIRVEIDDAMAELSGGSYRLHDAVIDPESRSQEAPKQEEPAPAEPAVPEAPVQAENAAQAEPAAQESPAREEAAPVPVQADPEEEVPVLVPAETEEDVFSKASEEIAESSDDDTTVIPEPQEKETDEPVKEDSKDAAEEPSEKEEPAAASEPDSEEAKPEIPEQEKSEPASRPEETEEQPRRGLFGKLFGHKQ